MSIPILGQGPAPVSTGLTAQERLNISNDVGEAIAKARSLQLGHGRMILMGPVNSTSAAMLAFFDAIFEAGCTIVAVCEHAANSERGPVLQTHVFFRLPRVGGQ